MSSVLELSYVIYSHWVRLYVGSKKSTQAWTFATRMNILFASAQFDLLPRPYIMYLAILSVFTRFVYFLFVERSPTEYK